MKRIAIGLSLLLSISVLPALAATPIKPGAACSKLGVKKEYAGKEFTCIRSGKKKLWSKGLAKNSAAPTSPKNSDTAQEGHVLGKDSRVTSLAKLSNVEICKTTDQTPGNLLNGFPRPKNSLSGAKSAKVLLIPLSFVDRQFLTTPRNSNRVDSDFDLAKKALTFIEDGFKELSAGRFNVKSEILPEEQWWVFDFPDPMRGGWGVWQNMAELVRLSNEKKPQFQFNDYDAYIFITSNYVGATAAQGDFQAPVKNSKTGFANLALMYGNVGSYSLYIHELFHALFAFEDLYLFELLGSPGAISELSIPEVWDIMVRNDLTLLNWNRLLTGWLRDSEIRCVTNQARSTHYLTSFGDNPEPKLTLINLTDGVTLAAEVRDKGSEKGLLVYIIDTYIEHGQGPIKTFNTLMTKGMKRSIYGWDISVLDNDKDGVLFDVLKTDVDKYVVPEKKPINNGPTTGSPIPLTGGEIVRKSATTAEIRWNPSNYESYRVYVTATNDFQKVYFETGFVDSNASPLVVEIKGLVCGVDLRVMNLFSTKKGGKGELRVEERILSRSQC